MTSSYDTLAHIKTALRSDGIPYDEDGVWGEYPIIIITSDRRYVASASPDAHLLTITAEDGLITLTEQQPDGTITVHGPMSESVALPIIMTFPTPTQAIDDVTNLLTAAGPHIIWGYTSHSIDPDAREVTVLSADSHWVRAVGEATDEHGDPYPGFMSCLYEVVPRTGGEGYDHEYAGSERYYLTAAEAAADLARFATE